MPGKYTGYEYGCLMIDYHFSKWNKFVHALVKANDIYPDEGFEEDAHITALYGFHDDELDFEKLKKSLPAIKTMKAKMTKLDMFETDNYDVIKFNIESPALIKLNKMLRSKFKYTTDFPKYEPHMTVAYVKKGLGKQYVSKLTNARNLNPAWFRYSGPKHGIKYF